MTTIHEKLALQDVVPVLYLKADGTMKAYCLTQSMAPSYVAKTDRIKVETPSHLVNAYDLTGEKFVSLKVANIASY